MIPTKGRKDEDTHLRVLRDALVIRTKITEVLRVLSLKTQKRINELSDRGVYAKDDSEISAVQEEMRKARFDEWLIKGESENIAKTVYELTGMLRRGNTIFPSKEHPAFVEEVKERRLYMDRALGACYSLLDELQYIAEEVYTDKNKFTPLALEIDILFKRIKNLRQADNRFIKKQEA